MEYKMVLKKKEFTKEGFKYTYVLYSRVNRNENFKVEKDVTAVPRSEYLFDKRLCK